MNEPQPGRLLVSLASAVRLESVPVVVLQFEGNGRRAGTEQVLVTGSAVAAD